MAEREWGHDELATDLAVSRGGNGEAVACPLSLGMFGRGGAADVAAIRLSRSQPASTIWEVKRTRADFWSDVNSGKYTRYLPYCHRFYFATPAGLLKREEIPEGAGWTVRGERGWNGVVAAPRRQVTDENWAEITMAHLMAAHPGPWQAPTRVCRLRSELAREKSDLSALLASRDARLQEIARSVKERERDLESVRHQIEKVLGEDADPDRELWLEVSDALHRARREGSPDPAPGIRAALLQLSRIETAAITARARLENGHA